MTGGHNLVRKTRSHLATNDFSITHRPMPTHSCWGFLRLWRCLHMGTVNIWSHLLGCLTFLQPALLHVGPMITHILPQYVTDLPSASVFSNPLLRPWHCLSYAVKLLVSNPSPLRKANHPDNTCLSDLVGTSMTHYAFYGWPVVQKVCWSIIICSVVATEGVLFDT